MYRSSARYIGLYSGIRHMSINNKQNHLRCFYLYIFLRGKAHKFFCSLVKFSIKPTSFENSPPNRWFAPVAHSWKPVKLYPWIRPDSTLPDIGNVNDWWRHVEPGFWSSVQVLNLRARSREGFLPMAHSWHASPVFSFTRDCEKLLSPAVVPLFQKVVPLFQKLVLLFSKVVPLLTKLVPVISYLYCHLWAMAAHWWHKIFRTRWWTKKRWDACHLRAMVLVWNLGVLMSQALSRRCRSVLGQTHAWPNYSWRKMWLRASWCADGGSNVWPHGKVKATSLAACEVPGDV